MPFRESRGSFASAFTSPKRTMTAKDTEFIRLTQSISSNAQKIQSNVREMKRLLADLKERPHDAQMLSKLYDIQQKTNALAKETSKSVQDINKFPHSSDVPEKRKQKIQRERVVSKFTETLNDFQVVQEEAKEKTRKRVAFDKQSVKRFRESQQASPACQEEAVIFQGQKQQQIVVQLDISDVELELMREREEELHKLEADIVDINQIFRDLGMMVHEQAEVIDIIEDNVEMAAITVEEGKESLEKAVEHKMKADKKKCIIIVVILVVVAVLITIILASTLSTKH